MNRERALKVVLVLLGLLFSPGVYPLMVFVKQSPVLVVIGVTLIALAPAKQSAERISAAVV